MSELFKTRAIFQNKLGLDNILCNTYFLTFLF